MVITLGQQYNVGEKPTVILYTYINRVVVVVDFTLNTVLTSIQYPCLSYSSRRQRNEFPWSQANPNKAQKNNDNKKKDSKKVPTLATKI